MTPDQWREIESHRDLTGQTLGHYCLVRRIGQGGMGEIYAADDSRLGRQVALKVFWPGITRNAGSLRRFQQEARAASALNHPNIVTVHDFGEDAGVYYLAMELVQGRTLRETIASHSVPAREIVPIVEQIAGALAAAHAAGIIHRDIKPENLMVRPDGYVKVLDFGLAKLRQPENLDQSLTFSQPGTVMGTVRYMSPEQVRGLEMDARSDLFSLGIVLYELVTGRCPFDGATAAHVLVSILEGEALPVDPTEAQPALIRIIRKCLRKAPSERYQSAQELLADLRQVQYPVESAASAASPKRLKLELFGNLKISFADQLVTSVNTNRLQSLLGYLALEGETPQPREHLAFLLWPESGESQARTNLRQLLHNLRRALPAESAWLAADNHTVQWRRDPACTIDVVEFERSLADAEAAARRGDAEAERMALEEATRLYQDDLLRGLYDDWVQPKREHYRARLWQALSRLATLQEARRDYPAAIRNAERLVAQDPLRESHHQLLIRLHAGNRDRAGALRAYHQCMRVLRRELGVDPGTATRALFDQVLRSGVPEEAHTELPPASAALPLPMVGRKHEWAGLTECWRMALRGRTHLAVILGEPGIGKSRLAEELFEWCARDGRPVARARCYAAQGQLAYAPVAEWLRSDPLRTASAGLPQAQLAELARVLPEILARTPEMPRPHPLTESWERAHFYDSLNATFAKAAKPLLLLIDDMQWCDPDSFEWLHSLFRAEAARGILVLGTVRSEETGRTHPFTRLLADLKHQSQVTEFPLTAFDAEDTLALATQVAGEPIDVAALQGLYGATKGHPLFVVETIRAGLGTGASATPPRIHAVIAGRLAQLTLPAYELAGVAGVIGRAFSFDLLARATDWDEESLSRALDELWQRRIIEGQGEAVGSAHYDFTHDRLREVAYAELSPVRRRFLHRRIARAIEELHGADLEAVSGQLAAHYAAAGMAEQAIQHYRGAAAVAVGRFADAEAAGMLRKALVLCREFPQTARRDQQELELLVTLGPALVTTHGYSMPEVGETYARALELSSRLGEKKHRFSALSGSWVFNIVSGQLQTSWARGDEFLRLAAADGQPALIMAGNFLLGSSTFQMGQFAAAHDHFTRAMSAYDGPSDSALSLFAGPDVRVFCQSTQGHVLWQLGHCDQALRKSDEAIAAAEAVGHPFSRAIAIDYRAMLHLFRYEPREALRWAEEGSAICSRHEFAYYRSMGEIVAGWAMAVEGDPQAGLTRLRRGLESLKATGAEVRLPFYHGLLAEVSALAGRPGEALANIATGLAFENKNGEHWAAADLHRIHGDLLRDSGNQAQAQASYSRAIESARQTGAKVYELRAAARLCTVLSQPEASAAARQTLQALCRNFTEGLETYDFTAAERCLLPAQNAFRTPGMSN